MKILLLLALFPLTAFSQFAADGRPTVSVSGSGEVKVAPDEVYLRVGVLTRDADLFKATQQNADAIAAALKYLDEQEIEKKHISTDSISVQPDFDTRVSYTKPVSFNVQKSIEVKLTDIDKLGEILTGLLAHGINQVQGIELRSSEFRKYRDEARAMAARAAREKAEALTAELGVKVGKVQTISASDWDGVGYASRQFAANSFQNVVQNVNDYAGAGDGSLSLGQIGIRATVNVTFLIE